MNLKKNGNGHNVEIVRPLKHRPDVIVVKTSDGRKKVIGDGKPFSSAELIEMQGMAPSTTPRLEFTEAEQAALDAAEDRLQRASSLVNSFWNELSACRKSIEDLCQGALDAWGNPKPSAGEAEVKVPRLREEGKDIKRRMDEAGKVESDALRELNAVRYRITTAATTRQFPPQYANPLRTADERLHDLEKGDDGV